MAKWNGWWQQSGFGRQMMQDLVLNIDPAGFVSGDGQDCIGPFIFSGQFHRDGRVSLLKQYIGRHRVAYDGCNSGEGIYGTWRIPDTSLWQESGKFALRPMPYRTAEHEKIPELIAEA